MAKTAKASKAAIYNIEETIKSLMLIDFVQIMASKIDGDRNRAAKTLAKIEPEKYAYDDSTSIYKDHLQQHEPNFAGTMYVKSIDSLNYYLSAILTEVFQSNPIMLKDKSQISLETVLSFPDLKKLHNHIVHQKIQSLFYKNTNAIFIELGDKWGIKPLDEEKIKYISDCNQIRNIIVHNSGKINDLFRKRISAPEKYKDLEYINFTFNDAKEELEKHVNIVSQMDRYLIKKFPIKTNPIPVRAISKRWIDVPPFKLPSVRGNGKKPTTKQRK